MPDNFDANGLEIKSLTEIRDEKVADEKVIYGNDINTNQNTPDGQRINIESQSAIDGRELLVKINNGFDPDQAEGSTLDQRVGINGIKRQGGTFTFQTIGITIDRALTLIGLDTEATELNPDIEDLYIVRDDEGNEFYLLDTQTEAGAGVYPYTFRAAELGEVLVLPNTITTPVTIIAGVTNINNPSAVSSIGIDEESDADLKKRRRTSVSLPALGFLDAIEAALRNVENVSVANVYENDTNVTDSDGIPGHTIWAIIEGGDDEELAQVLYAKKTSGCGFKGDEIINLPRPEGNEYTVRLDRPDDEELYIRFKLTGAPYDVSTIRNSIVTNVIWNIGKGASGSTVTAYVQSINALFKIEDMEISDDGASWVEVLDSTSLQFRFLNDVIRITIT